MKILLQAIKSLLRKVENTAERVLNFFGGDGIIKQEHLPDGYPYGEIVEILPSTTVVTDFNTTTGNITTPFTLVVGNEYKVRWNNEEYICTAQVYGFTDDKLWAIALGDMGIILGENITGEPFLLINFLEPEDGNVHGRVVTLEGFEFATISIHSGTATKMDVKYFPDGYPYIETAEILPRTTININPDDGGAAIQTPFTLVPGNEYTVTFNGEDYTCIAQMVETEPGTFLVAIGNVGAIMEGSDTGEPFVVGHLASEVGSLLHQIIVLDGSTSVTISIVGDRIVKMDARYLPDPIISSPNGTRYKITVDDSGTLSATAITE